MGISISARVSAGTSSRISAIDAATPNEPTPSSKFDRRYVISGDSEEAESIKQTILDALESVAYDQTSCYAIRLALEEALTNAFKHGNQSDPRRCGCRMCAVEGGGRS